MFGLNHAKELQESNNEMAFNINELLSTINANDGLAEASQFAIRITPPAGLTNDAARELTFLCMEASLPGTSVGTDDVRMKGYGLVEQRPTSQLFEDLSCTFICDAGGKVQSFFNDWMKMLFNFNHETGQRSGNIDFESFGYPDDYIAPGFEIIQYKGDGSEIMTYKLDRAFPKTIGSLAMGWDMTDSFLKLPVSFTYRSWVVDKSGSAPSQVNPQTHSLYTDGGYPDNILSSPTNLAQQIFTQ